MPRHVRFSWFRSDLVKWRIKKKHRKQRAEPCQGMPGYAKTQMRALRASLVVCAAHVLLPSLRPFPLLLFVQEGHSSSHHTLLSCGVCRATVACWHSRDGHFCHFFSFWLLFLSFSIGLLCGAMVSATFAACHIRDVTHTNVSSASVSTKTR